MPFASDLVQAAQEELPKSHHRLDDAEHRFNCLLAQCVQRTPGFRLQAMHHGLQRRGIIGQRRRFAVPFAPTRMMRLARHRDQRRHLRGLARQDVLLAAIASVGYQAVRLAQRR
jgi:hypothetical protein